MRAATWNVWWRFGGNWREREPGLVATLRSVTPDVVGLQEAWATEDTTQAHVLAERLGMHAAFVEQGLPAVPEPPEEPDQAGVQMGVGLLSRWPVASAERVPLPSAELPNAALVAEVAHPRGPLHVIVAGTDWEPDRRAVRAEQFRVLGDLALESSRDGDLPVLILADLNAGPDDPDLAALTARLADAYAASAWPTDDDRTLSSTNRFAPSEAVLQYDRRIDYVLVRPGRADARLEVRAAGIDRTEHDGLPPSDHYLLWADLGDS